jgi:phosphatidylinositol glycan class B
MVSVTRTGLTGSTRATYVDYQLVLREAILCGTAVITISALSDRSYFGEWTFPPYQWLNFNINQDLAVFYGKNDWHYYYTQGLPLLLTTYLPFGLYALWSASSLSSTAVPARISNTRFQITVVVLAVVTTLSRISHKEVRFIYPILPCLHILAAPHVLSFFSGTELTATILNASSKAKISVKSWRLVLLFALVITNLGLGVYTTQFHQRGVIDVLSFLRREYEDIHLTTQRLLSPKDDNYGFGDRHQEGNDPEEMFVGFLMPCHSTPWRSHLVYPTLRAWALSCEPPVDIPVDSPERTEYRDQADRFYDDPINFLSYEIHDWPRYIVGFEGIESDLATFYEQLKAQKMSKLEMRRKWSGFNSHWHDDSRRKGKVVVWEFVQPQESPIDKSVDFESEPDM